VREQADRGDAEVRDRRSVRKAAAPAPDRETRARLLDVARTLFAARGYREVTVREICSAARANVAAVNYHFGDKVGLYREVIDEAIVIMRQTSRDAEAAGDGQDAEGRLRAFISVFLQRVGHSQDSWIRQLFTHEMAEPTDAFDDVITKVIEPRMYYLQTLVAEILGTQLEDERVLRCAVSVQFQFQAAMANPVSRRLAPGYIGTPGDVERLAQHIADFSLGGIRSLRDAEHTTDA
jgi:TetR/AcrR family transcriptional regulator, regulator of cefoperazone and chloramphenicol sensitivity